MQTDEDAELICTEEALLSLTRNERDEVRAWAITRLGVQNPRASRKAALANVTHDNVAVRLAALACLDESDLDEPAVEALRAMEGNDSEAWRDLSRRSRELLVLRGDEAATGDALRRVELGEEVPVALINALVLRAPDRLRAVFRAAIAGGGAAARRRNAAAEFGRVAELEDLPWFVDEAAEADRHVRRIVLAGLAWVEDLAMPEYSSREWTQQLDALRTLDDDTWEHPDAAHQSLRRTARSYLSIDPWKKTLSAFRSRQFWHVIEEAALLWARFSPGPDAPASPWFTPAFKAISRARSPGFSDAALALTLVLGGMRRALLGRVDLATSDLARAIRWACVQGGELPPFACQRLVERWRRLPEGDATRSAVERVLRGALGSSSVRTRMNAMSFFQWLPDAALDADAIVALRQKQGDREANALLALLFGRPALYRASATAVLREERHPLTATLVGGLASQFERWAPRLLTEHLSRIARDREALVSAMNALAFIGDSTTLGPLTTVVNPDVPATIDTGSFLVRLSACMAADARDDSALLALPMPDEGPLAVRLRCNRCNALATHVVGGAHLDPDSLKCRRDGWDSVVFDRVVTCAACGAEDDYTLGVEQLFVLIDASTRDRLANGDAPVERDTVTAYDGVPVRRRGALIQRYREETEQRPDDSVAWEHLGDALRDAGRPEEAFAAWRTSMAASADNVTVVIGYYEYLRETKDLVGMDALIDEVVARWPAGRTALEDPKDTVTWLEGEFSRWVERRGKPLTLVCGFSAVEGLAEPPLAEGALPLHRLEEHVGARAMLLDPRLTSLRLTRDDPAEPTPLELLLAENELIFLPRLQWQIAEARKAAERSDTARLGRNDPCHCGSGKKFKKCHGK